MNQTTKNYIERSPFEIKGFQEIRFHNSKIVEVINHTHIPDGRHCGESGTLIETLTEDTVFTLVPHAMRLKSDVRKTKLKRGSQLVNKIEPICGRAKVEYQKEYTHRYKHHYAISNA